MIKLAGELLHSNVSICLFRIAKMVIYNPQWKSRGIWSGFPCLGMIDSYD